MSKSPMVCCYESHPALQIGDDPKSLIYGGSCSSPIVYDAHVYIGFDRYPVIHPRRLPWIPGESFVYPIANNQPPDNPDEFRTLIAWTWRQISYGMKVHVGCIGGHGRTGLFIAALEAWVTGRTDAIQYVRENYCERAVETAEQLEFLEEHYGCYIKRLKPIYSSPKKYTGSQIDMIWNDEGEYE